MPTPIKYKIQRFHEGFEPEFIDMEYSAQEGQTLLQALIQTKEKKDRTLTFKSGCKSGVCGSCAVRVNGKEVLACKYKLQDGDYVQSLRFHQRVRDLVVKSNASDIITQTHAYLATLSDVTTDAKNILSFVTQSDCILCGACHSTCPVLETNPSFIAPYAYSRVQKYQLNSKESNKKEKLSTIQDNGIWDCTGCMGCTFVCPQGLDPKSDIDMLKNSSVANGFEARFAQPMGFDLTF